MASFAAGSAGRRGSAQLLFDSLAEVLDQMKTVSDLPRLRRPPAGSLSIEAAAIPADDLDFRMLAQPTGGRLRRVVRQNVDNLAPLQIDNDRAIAGPLCHSDRRCRQPALSRPRGDRPRGA